MNSLAPSHPLCTPLNLRCTSALSKSNSLPDLETLSQRLGHNPYDAYGVAVQMRQIFAIPFMQKSNPDAYRRWSDSVTEAEGGDASFNS